MMGIETVWKATFDNEKEADYGSKEEFLGHTEGLVFKMWDCTPSALSTPDVHERLFDGGLRISQAYLIKGKWLGLLLD